MQETMLIPVSRRLSAWFSPYPEILCETLFSNEFNPDAISEIGFIGQHLLVYPEIPLVGYADRWSYPMTDFIRLLRSAATFPVLDEITCLGFAAVVCITEELKREDNRRAFISEPELSTGTAFLFYRYLVRRRTGNGKHLPDLPVPAQFRQVLRDWAEGRVDFVGYLEEEF